jgi:ribosomal protein S18 acetylase RimI-like enzyme
MLVAQVKPNTLGSTSSFTRSLELQVRRLKTEEWPQYRDVRLRALADSPEAFASSFAQERVRPESEWQARVAAAADAPHQLPLVLVDGAELLGLTWGRIEDSDPEVAHLFQMWVAPEHRGNGHGRLLLAAAVSWARESGARFMDLDVAVGDTPARRLYLQAGFSDVGQPLPMAPGATRFAQPMRLEL